MLLSKTDYILYRDCPKNVWLKIHKPEIYSNILSDFEMNIVQSGNEVELIARKLFKAGILVEGRDKKAEQDTIRYLESKQKVLFQPIFVTDKFLAAVDVLEYSPEDDSYAIYEIKSTNGVDDKVHYHDIAFQVNLLRQKGLKVSKAYLIHLNPEYVRYGELKIEDNQLFKITDVTAEIESLAGEVAAEMDLAQEYISKDDEPNGYCLCIYKGRSKHCSMFKYSNPDIPEYSIHDIARIGSSKKKLEELVDTNIFKLDEIPAHIKLSEIQQNQVESFVSNKVIRNNLEISLELKRLNYPLYFLDYETYPCAIPRFDGFSPYQQIPFQYSVHILNSPDSELEHKEFLYIGKEDPSIPLAAALQNDIGPTGTVIVWNKKFESKINQEIGQRIPLYETFMESVNNRIYDLMDIFSKQFYVHKDFKGSTSIKYVLPALVPELHYQDLNIQEGGAASDCWNKVVSGLVGETDAQSMAEDLKKYCGRDTEAMYAIWHHLFEGIKDQDEPTVELAF